jgi:hypothetical protein
MSLSDSNLASENGALEDKKAAGKGGTGEVRRWKLEVALAEKCEKDWRKTANEARKTYRGEKKAQNSYNILWANTEVIAPNLYNSAPRPDVRRRYRDADPVGKQVAEVLERALSFESDFCDFNEVMKAAVFDSVLPGRGTCRIRFDPTYEEVEKTAPPVAQPVLGQPMAAMMPGMQPQGQEIASQMTPEMESKLTSAKAYPEKVCYDAFTLAPSDTWENMPWLKYEHELTKAEIKEKFPGFEEKVQYDVMISGGDDKLNIEPSVFMRCRVWEIWDKTEKKVLWIAPTYEQAPLKVEDDKLGLRDFYDMPKPIYAIEDTSSLIPVCEYSLYEEQAKELNRITKRINKLTEALKVRGVYDATLVELQALMQSDDNDMVPTKDSTIALQAGGFDKAIWMMPIEQLAKVLAGLYTQREQIKMIIYEVIGISDILRGSTNPNETLGAQQLKAQTGSVRLQRRQRDVQRFARDAFNIMAEIMAEHYPAELLTIMTGVQVTPEMVQVMQRDLMRGIRVDVETDSTIAADQAKSRAEVAEIMEGVGGFVQSFGPAVQSGALSMDSAKKVFISVIRKAKLGREVEDALEQDAQQPAQEKPDPEMMKMQAEQQGKQAEMQMKAQENQATLAMDEKRLQMDGAKMEQEATLKREQMQIDAQLKREQMMLDAQLKREAEQMKANVSVETERMRSEASSKPATTLQFDTDGALDKTAQTIEQIAVSAAQNSQQNNEAMMMAINAMTEALQLFAQSQSAPKTIKTPDGRIYTASIN